MTTVGIHSVAFQPSVGAPRRYATWQVVAGCGGRRSRLVLDFRPRCNLNGVDDDVKLRKLKGVVWIQRYVERSVDAVGEFGKEFVPSATYVMQKCVRRSELAAEGLRGVITSLPPVTVLTSRYNGKDFAIGLGFAITMLLVSVRVYVSSKSRNTRPPGSVADLVRRGQLRSDRRGISKPVQYDDPFDNPYVKVGKQKSTVEMCGKVYRLAPVSLTEEQRAVHQKRRSSAYQWKRPTIFLKEGDQIPPDVDPDTVRWIPANHPFATTTTDINEDLAQSNVYQKHGVPSRIQAEHEALQKKLEALQNEKEPDKLVIDASAAKEFGRTFRSSRMRDPADQIPSIPQQSNSRSPNDHTDSFESDETKLQQLCMVPFQSTM